MSLSMNPYFSDMNKYFVTWPARDVIVRKEKRHPHLRCHRKGEILAAGFQISSVASVLLRMYTECRDKRTI